MFMMILRVSTTCGRKHKLAEERAESFQKRLDSTFQMKEVEYT